MKRRTTGGFTIVESLIVLAITGVLFASLAAMVSGRQAKAQFKAAMTDITTQIQSQIQEVATGYYPSAGDFSCSAPSGSPELKNTASPLGENSDCTFLGRAMMYGIPDTDPQEYKIHTLVGLRRTNLPGRAEPRTLREAKTQVIARGSLFNDVTSKPNWPDLLSTSKTLQSGTELVYMRDKNNTKLAGFAVVAAPDNQLSFDLNNAVEAGTIVPSIIPIPNDSGAAAPGVTAAQGVDLIIRSLGSPSPTATALPTSAANLPIKLCFASGTTNQSGLVTIGSNNSTTSVEFIILNNRTCT